MHLQRLISFFFSAFFIFQSQVMGAFGILRPVSPELKLNVVVNGLPASIAQQIFSNVVVLEFRGAICSGFLVHRKLIVTAAHCIVLTTQTAEEKENFQLRILGVTSFGVREIAKFENHSDLLKNLRMKPFSPSKKKGNDLALIMLNDPAPHSFSPIVIHSGQIRSRTHVIQAGFGYSGPDELGGPWSLDLLNTKSGIVISSDQTEFVVSSALNQTICSGDSGGPTYFYDPKNGQLSVLGVTVRTDGDRNANGNCRLNGRSYVHSLLNHETIQWLNENIKQLSSDINPLDLFKSHRKNCSELAARNEIKLGTICYSEFLKEEFEAVFQNRDGSFAWKNSQYGSTWLFNRGSYSKDEVAHHGCSIQELQRQGWGPEIAEYTWSVPNALDFFYFMSRLKDSSILNQQGHFWLKGRLGNFGVFDITKNLSDSQTVTTDKFPTVCRSSF